MDTLLKFEIEEILGTRAGLQDDPENDEDGVPELDPVGRFVAKMQLDSLAKSTGVDFGWDAPVSIGDDEPLAKNHPLDGDVIEQHGREIWTYTYKAGKCVHQKVQAPDLPGGLMHFDENGDEIAA